MVKKVVICDICNEQFSPYANDRVKLSTREESYCNFDDFEYRKWKKFDLCPACANNLIRQTRQMTRGDDNEDQVR